MLNKIFSADNMIVITCYIHLMVHVMLIQKKRKKKGSIIQIKSLRLKHTKRLAKSCFQQWKAMPKITVALLVLVSLLIFAHKSGRCD